MRRLRNIGIGLAASFVLIGTATLLADVASDLTGPVGPTGFTGNVGPTGPDGAGYTGLGLSCGSNGVRMSANGFGVTTVCSTSPTRHLEVLGATNGSAAGVSRVAPVQATSGALVATASGLNNTAVYVENVGAANAALSAASAVTGGTVDLSGATLGLPLRALSFQTAGDFTSPKTATVLCDVTRERAVSGSCMAHASGAAGQATISKRCFTDAAGNCVASGAKAVGFSCTGSIGLQFYVAAYVQCLAE